MSGKSLHAILFTTRKRKHRRSHRDRTQGRTLPQLFTSKPHGEKLQGNYMQKMSRQTPHHSTQRHTSHESNYTGTNNHIQINHDIIRGIVTNRFNKNRRPAGNISHMSRLIRFRSTITLYHRTTSTQTQSTPRQRQHSGNRNK